MLRRCLSENVPWIVARDVMEDLKAVCCEKECVLFSYSTQGVLNDSYFASSKVCSAMVVQIRSRNVVQGLVYLENHKLPGVFHQSMAKSLSTLVSQLGISLRNAQLFEELQRSHDATLRFVPASFLARVGCAKASDLKRGDSVQKKLAIMFADIRGFTAISESMDTRFVFFVFCFWFFFFLNTIQILVFFFELDFGCCDSLHFSIWRDCGQVFR